MKKLMKRLLNNKGLTLTELIVALFLTSVILAIAVGMLAPVKDLMNTMKSNAHMDTISSTVGEYVRGTLQAATSLKFVTLDSNNEIQPSDREGVKDFFSNHSKVRALAVLNVNDDASEPPVYRLYDFDAITSGGYTDLINMLDAKDQDKYGVFNTPFYNGTSCVVEFYSDGTTLQVASQCFRNDEMLNQKHVLNFRLLNSSVSPNSGGIKTDADLNGADPEIEIEGHSYLILYTLYDWTA